MRYKPHDHEDSIAGGWDVTKDDVCPRRNRVNWSEAEAEIIAFALNAVAEGDMLARDWGAPDVFDPTKMEYYDGPTDLPA
jgi:hypothetical protein